MKENYKVSQNSFRQEVVPSLMDYWQIVFKRKWTILTVFSVVAVTWTLKIYSVQPIYEGVTKIVIDMEGGKNILPIQGVYSENVGWYNYASYYQTQFKILKSRSSAKVVFEKLESQLMQDPTFKNSPDPIALLESCIIIEPLKDTKMVHIKARHPNPQMAVLIANAVSQSYIDQSLQRKLDAAQYAIDWLNQQIVSTRNDVEKSEYELQQYIEKNQIIHMPRIEEGSKKEEMISFLGSEKAKLETHLVELSKQYKPKHPKYAQVQAVLSSVDVKLKQEIESIMDLNRKASQFSILQREVETNRHLYNTIVGRIKETNLFESLQSSNISIIDFAEIPRVPVYPNKFKNIIGSCVVGFLFGFGLAFLLENLDHTVRKIDEIQALTGLPVWGSIPDAYALKKGIKSSEIDLGCYVDGKSIFAESYRYVRTGISFSDVDNPPRTILITSSVPKEGKTADAVNLAITYASSGEKVLLVDSDMRNPRVHKVFNLDVRSHGLSSILSGNIQESEACTETQIPNLFLIRAGVTPPNPAELLDSKRMKEFLLWAENNFNRIIIDSPPVMAVADSIILSNAVDGVLYIVRSGYTHRKQLLQSINKLNEARANILGLVLNRVGGSSDGYGYGYGYYPYHYRYYGNKEDGDSGNRPSLKERILRSV